MEVFGSEIHQVFVKLLDGKHRILNFNAPSISVAALKHRIETVTSIPSHIQLLLFNNSHIIDDDQTLTLVQSRESRTAQDQDFFRFGSAGFDGLGKFPVVVHMLLRLRGGKGGFGSLLRGAATKAGQKKTNNFDACRDMSGRRLRHVNAEKKLEEWRAEAEERKLEKMAEEFIKKKTKEVLKKGKSNGDSAEKYVAKYREDSAKCMEEVERSVRESIKGMVSSKRKNCAEGSESASKRLKIWMGKRKLGDSDSEESEDLDEVDIDEEIEEESEKSVIIDNGSHSDSSKEADASSGSITGGKLDRSSSESGSEEEDTVAEESLKLNKSLGRCGEDGNGKNIDNPVIESLEINRDHNKVVSEEPQKSHSSEMDEIVSQQLGFSGSEKEAASATDVRNSSTPEPVPEESMSVGEDLQNLDKPLNFDEYQSAAELEVLGLERLKSELQARGLKCGGTLQERATRLFLLKTTPLEMLPKKLFAKK